MPTKTFFSPLIPLLIFLINLTACTLGNCFLKSQPLGQEKAQKMKEALVESDITKKIKVYKLDGSLQCNQGEATTLAEMAKQLKDIKILKSYKTNDGVMRIQVCGAPTGNCNVYEIEQKNLEKALKLGFKQWVND